MQDQRMPTDVSCTLSLSMHLVYFLCIQSFCDKQRLQMLNLLFAHTHARVAGRFYHVLFSLFNLKRIWLSPPNFIHANMNIMFTNIYKTGHLGNWCQYKSIKIKELGRWSSSSRRKEGDQIGDRTFCRRMSAACCHGGDTTSLFCARSKTRKRKDRTGRCYLAFPLLPLCKNRGPCDCDHYLHERSVVDVFIAINKLGTPGTRLRMCVTTWSNPKCRIGGIK